MTLEALVDLQGLNEHKLQHELTQRWIERGLDITGRRCMLLAWEPMFPSWETNYYKSKWDEPSLDFVFVDETGTLYALELKPEVQAPGAAWRALAQVTHRAALIHRSRTFEKLQMAFVLSRTHHSRNAPGASGDGLELLERHWEYFGLGEPLMAEAFTTGPVARVVGARRFGPSWAAVRERFTCESEVEIVAHLKTYKANRDNRAMTQLVELGRWRHLVTPTIAAVVVP